MVKLTLRIPEDIHELLKAKADADHRSVNSYLLRLIETDTAERRSTTGIGYPCPAPQESDSPPA